MSTWCDELRLAARVRAFPAPRPPREPRRGRHRIGEGGLSWLSLPQTRDMLANYLNELPHLLYDEWAETAEDGVMDDFDDEVVFCLSALWRTTNDQVHSLGKLLSWVDVGAHSACAVVAAPGAQHDAVLQHGGRQHDVPRRTAGRIAEGRRVSAWCRCNPASSSVR